MTMIWSMIGMLSLALASASECPAELDLCGDTRPEVSSGHRTLPGVFYAFSVFLPRSAALPLLVLGVAGHAAADTTCGDVQEMYRSQQCCGEPAKAFDAGTICGSQYMCPTGVQKEHANRNEFGENYKSSLKAISGTGLSAEPEGVILFVGDGMSQEIQSIAEHQMVQALWTVGAKKDDGTPYNVADQTDYRLHFRKDDWDKEYVSTHSYDDFVPDSASTASAMMNGQSALAGTLNVQSRDRTGGERGKETLNHWRRNMVTEFHIAKMNGHPVGFVADSRITHATPAGMWANSADRNFEATHPWVNATGLKVKEHMNSGIAEQYLFSGFGLPDVVLGGGERNFCFDECVHGRTKRNGLPIDLVAKAKALFGDKIVFVYNEEELKDATTDAEIEKYRTGEKIALFGFFDDSSLAPSLHRDVFPGDPRYRLYESLIDGAEAYMKSVDDNLTAEGKQPIYTQRRVNNLAQKALLGSKASTEPSLPEMTVAAVKVLQARSEYLSQLHKQTKQYFLMSEASEIDWWMHSSDYALAADEVFMLEKAIIESESIHQNKAVVLVTADHSHGISTGGYFPRTLWWNEPISKYEAGKSGTTQIGVVYGSGALHHPTADSDWMFGPKINPYAFTEHSNKVSAKLYEWGFNATEVEHDELTRHQLMVIQELAKEIDSVTEAALLEKAKTSGVGALIGAVGNPEIPRMVAMAPGFKAPAVFYSNGGSHGGSEVPLYCKGPGDACAPLSAHKGTISQGFIAQFFRCVARLDRYNTTEHDVTKAFLNTFYIMQHATGVKYHSDLSDDKPLDMPYFRSDVMDHTLEGVSSAFRANIESACTHSDGVDVSASYPIDLLADMEAAAPSEYAYPVASNANKFYVV